MSDPIKITDPHRIPPTFVNQLVGQGFLNGVINLTFGTALFTPAPDGTVDTDMVITSRLRMDLYAAKQLRDALDVIIEKNTKPSNTTEH